MTRKGGYFKNTKLGKNVFRQIKRRGEPGKPKPQKSWERERPAPKGSVSS